MAVVVVAVTANERTAAKCFAQQQGRAAKNAIVSGDKPKRALQISIARVEKNDRVTLWYKKTCLKVA